MQRRGDYLAEALIKEMGAHNELCGPTTHIKPSMQRGEQDVH